MKPIGFFVHHQGRGHAKRCEAIINHLPDQPITIFCADPDLFGVLDSRVTLTQLPNMIGDAPQTPALFEHDTPDAMHCVPVGSALLQSSASIIAKFLGQGDPSLFVIDVSAEWALLSRIFSVPSVLMRLHGARADAGHIAAMQASSALLAPFAETLEQQETPDWVRAKTHYTGGLCTTQSAVLRKEEARTRLNLPKNKPVFLTLSGGGGTGAHYASLTMGARARPDALWLTIGPLHREGHETDFANLRNLGWVDDPLTYIAAADLVIASAGDNTVHEIARVGRPYLCIPEWRYFSEQHHKADALAVLNAAHVRQVWPGDLSDWRAALSAAMQTDIQAQRSLVNDSAAQDAAHFLASLQNSLWSGKRDTRRLAGARNVISRGPAQNDNIVAIPSDKTGGAKLG